MNLVSWHNRCALLLMVLAVTAYATASASPEFAVLAVPTQVALWRLSSRKAGRFLLPRMVVNFLLVAVMVYAALKAQMGLNVEVIAQVVVLIQIIKIGDRRAPRDDAQILCMSVFLAIAAMLDSNGIWTGIQLAVYLPLLITSVMLFQLYQGAVGAGGTTSTGPAPVAGEKKFRKQLRVTSGLATAGTIAVSLGVFVLLPRGVGAGALGSLGMSSQQRKTAFTNTVTLGVKGIISDSPKVVLDLVVRDEAGQNLGGEEIVQYLRGAVLTEYEAGSGRWSPSDVKRNKRQEVTLAPAEDPLRVWQQSSPAIEQTVSMHGTRGMQAWTHLFATWRPMTVWFSRQGQMVADLDTHVIRAKLEPGPFQYKVWSSLTEPERDVAADWKPGSYESPTIKGLAEAILRPSAIEPDPDLRERDDDARAARVIQEYLRTRYSYTLEQEAPPGEKDPIEFFLQDRKRGNCEYFAASMVLLCRSVGINARMVTGYIATEFNTATGAYIVRESNAHAWVEAEDGGHHYKRYDPTPPEDLARIHQASTGLLGRLRRALEAIEYAWNSSVVSFDEQSRQRILGPGRGESNGLLARVDRVSARVRQGGAPLMLRATVAGVVVFGAVASGGIIGSRIFERLRGRKRKAAAARGVHVAGSGPGSRQYRRLLRLLSRRGIGKPAWRPPMEHAIALAAVDGRLAGDVGGIVDVYYRERFGGVRPDEKQKAEAEGALARVKRFSGK